MSKVTPREYYKCDYCESTSDFPTFKHTDNSGINGQSYDMCSDNCLHKYIKFLKTKNIQDKYFIDGETIEEHMRNFITGRNFTKIDFDNLL